MRHKSFAAEKCPIAVSLERVGEWWSILILRDVFLGLRRFDELQKSLRIAPNMLTRRLGSLVEQGMLERRPYCEHPPRYEYVPTDLARDFRPVMWTLLAWGNRHFFPEGPSVVLVDRRTGRRAEPVVVDRITGMVITESDFCSAPTPTADDATYRRYARAPNWSQPTDPQPLPPAATAAALRGSVHD